MILKAYKYRIYPTDEQAEKLGQTIGCARFVWNHLVANFNAYGTEEFKPILNEKILKDNPEFSFLKDVSATALQQKQRDFDETKKQFFNKKRKVKLGRMKFKKKKGSKQSYRLTNQKFTLDQDNSTIRLEKIGNVKIILDRIIPDDADYRSVTISKSPSGKFFVSILVKINIECKPLTGKMVGIDLGLNDLYILSNGGIINNPRWFKETQLELKKAQQHLSRKTPGSARYEKQRIKVARIHERIANQRNYFIHNITTALVTNYDVICIEDLNVSGMKKTNMGKSISDASWATFTAQLDYKCNWYGKTIVKIDRFYPSTQLCSNCGHRDGKKSLNIRDWICPVCGSHHDRDINAAVNILQKGFSDLTGEPIDYQKSAELVDYRRGEDVRLLDASHHLAASMKRQEQSCDYFS
jgi:putative transposase